MKIAVTREAVCLADDQLELLDLSLELGAEATLENFAGALAKRCFLHFSSTCHTLVGRSGQRPLLKLRSRWGSLAVEYLAAADTKLVEAVVDAAIDFRFERAAVLPPARSDLARRRPVWLALSDLFLDTDVKLLREGNARTLGWDISRDTLAKVESQMRWLSDFELAFLAEALAVPLDLLLPERGPVTRQTIREFVGRLSAGRSE